MKIYKFLEYSTYENKTRSVPLKEDEFLSILKNKCKNWYNNPKPLVRFKHNVDHHSIFSKINPKLSTRKSLNRHNYNTMLMDNLPSWSEFPKRSESIIFYNKIIGSMSGASGFGNKFYFVIPFDSAKIAAAPSDDLWNSKNKDISLSFDESFSEMLDTIGAPDNNYEEFIRYMNKTDPKDLKSRGLESYLFSKIHKEYNRYKENDFNTFMDFFNYLLRPNNFKRDFDNKNQDGYEVLDYTQTINKKHKLECWTDSECLLIYGGTVNDNIDIIDRQIENKFQSTVINTILIYPDLL